MRLIHVDKNCFAPAPPSLKCARHSGIPSTPLRRWESTALQNACCSFNFDGSSSGKGSVSQASHRFIPQWLVGARVNEHLEKSRGYHDAKKANNGLDPSSPGGQPHFEANFVPLFANAFQGTIQGGKWRPGSRLSLHMDDNEEVLECFQLLMAGSFPQFH